MVNLKWSGAVCWTESKLKHKTHILTVVAIILLILYIGFIGFVLKKIFEGDAYYLLLYILFTLPFYATFQLIIFKGFDLSVLPTISWDAEEISNIEFAAGYTFDITDSFAVSPYGEINFNKEFDSGDRVIGMKTKYKF